MERRNFEGTLRREEGRRLRAPRRVYADVLEQSRTALQRARTGVQGAWRRQRRLPLGQRRVRHERVGEGLTR